MKIYVLAIVLFTIGINTLLILAIKSDNKNTITYVYNSKEDSHEISKECEQRQKEKLNGSVQIKNDEQV